MAAAQSPEPWSRPYSGPSDYPDARPTEAPHAPSPVGAGYPPAPTTGAPTTGAGYPGTPTTGAGYPTAPTTGAGYPGAPTTGAGYPTAPTTGAGYPGAPTTGAGYPTAPTTGGAYPGAPTTGSGHPGGVYPGGPGAPTGTGAGAPAGGGGRLVRGALLGVGALVLALTSGVVGGAVADRSDSPGPTRTVTIAAAPPIDRSSVADVAAAVLPTVVAISTGQGGGSGVVISADGAIVTNNHVVEGASGNAVTVTFSDGKSAKATIVGTDPVGDIAVIRAEGVSGLRPAKFGDSNVARVGDPVLAIGSPLGLQGSVSEGIVSALHRTIDTQAQSGGGRHSIADAIQTDAAINPGNSGGALVNLAGEVIGINTAIATSGQGAGNIGVGFAISSNKAKSAADQLIKGGKVSHPYIGVQLNDGTGGALIADVVANGPAAKAGLQKGDLITKAGSRTIAVAGDLVAAVQAGQPGDKLELTVKRGGADQQITVTLAETP